jgi:hypothetical protein
MTTNHLKLYHSFSSPNSRRVRMFLAEKGLTVPLAPVDLAKGEQHSAMTPLERQRRRRAKLAKGGATKRSLLYNLGLAEAAFEELMTAMGQVFNARRSWARGH